MFNRKLHNNNNIFYNFYVNVQIFVISYNIMVIYHNIYIFIYINKITWEKFYEISWRIKISINLTLIVNLLSLII